MPPITLFRFIYDGVVGGSPISQFLYTDAETSVTEPSENLVYEPQPITHDNIRSNGTLDHATLTVSIPKALALADLFLVYPPSQPVTLILRAGHIGETVFPVKWTGRVIGCKRTAGVAELSCQPIQTALARPGLRRRYSLFCPYVLFDPDTCKANEANVTQSGIDVSGIAGQVLTVPMGWNGAIPVAKYNTGKAVWTNAATGQIERRRILDAQASRIRVAGLVRGLPINASPGPLSVVAGCNRNEDDCANIHNNLLNCGCMPLLPKDNPIGVNKFY